MSVKYQPAMPPPVASTDLQKALQYVYQEFIRISQSLGQSQNAPHAICKYNGSTPALIYSEGVSSVTKVSTGVYDVNLAAPLISVAAAYGSVISQSAGQILAEIDVANTTTTKIRVTLVTSTSGSAVDGQFILVVHG